MLHTTVGALKNRPSEIQESLCRTYVNYWLCDTPTIQRELSRVMNINSKTEQEIQKAEAKEYQANNIPEKREAINSADIQHRMNVIDGDDEHQKKVRQTEQEKARVGYITREIQRKNADMIRRKYQAEKHRKIQTEELEREKRP